MTYELAMKQHNDEEGWKKKTIALKSVANEKIDEPSFEEEEGDEDMALIIKKLRKFIGRRRQRFKIKNLIKRETSKEKKKEKDQPLCYEYKKLRYFKADGPTLKKSFKKIKKKVGMAMGQVTCEFDPLQPVMGWVNGSVKWVKG